ncbi:MAG: WG repeat-containing protein, partial [Bacteroidota bacterium]
RYTRTFGYYEELAGVWDEDQWFHIQPDGRPLYEPRYIWVGNFQQGRCVVQDADTYFFHIREEVGQRLSEAKFLYAGDFREGAAAVQLRNGAFTHIDAEGNYLHGKEYVDLGVFHKGFAIAKDSGGWFHIDRMGEAVYKHRFEHLEPFYNGVALAVDKEGKRVRVTEEGEIQELQPRETR